MNGRFFKILFNNTLKVVPCSKTLEQLLTSASQAFAVPISELNSCSYTEKENDVFSIDNEEDFKVLLSFMEKENRIFSRTDKARNRNASEPDGNADEPNDGDTNEHEVKL